MARGQKLYRLMTIAEFQKGDDGSAVSVTYAKDRRGARITFENGQHSGIYMIVWDGGNMEVVL